MNSRLPVLFTSAGPEYTPALLYSVETFLCENASDIGQFRPLVFLYRPDYETVETIKSTLKDRIPLQYVHADSKPACVRCIFRRYGARYGFVIPSDYYSLGPLWIYLNQIRQVISTYPNVASIKLYKDYDLANTITKEPIVYRYVTENIMIGNGNTWFNGPVVIKYAKAQTKPILNGCLTPAPFSKRGI